MSVTLNETCSCGAQFVWMSSFAEHAQIAAAQWREAHRHIAPPVAVEPGPCVADSGVTWPGREYTTRCDLRAGHAGAHEADRGSLGGTAVWVDAEVPSPGTPPLGPEAQ